MANKPFKKIGLCGDDLLLIQAYQQVFKKTPEACIILSDAPKILAWCKEKKIDYLPLHHLSEKQLNSYTIIYMLSRNQPDLPIKLARQTDTPIIAYYEHIDPSIRRGSAVSEAILRGKTQYGISFSRVFADKTHTCLEKISFQCALNETASSLINKCIYSAIHGLKIFCQNENAKLIEALKLPQTKERLESIDFIPPTGILDFQQSSVHLIREINALNYASFYNPYAYPCLALEAHQICLIDDAAANDDSNPSQKPGTILSITPELTIQCSNGSLTIKKLSALNGLEIDIPTYFESLNLHVGDTLPALTLSKTSYYAALTAAADFETNESSENYSPPSPSPYFSSNLESHDNPAIKAVNDMAPILQKLAGNHQRNRQLCFFTLSLIYCHLLDEEDKLNFSVLSEKTLTPALETLFSRQMPSQLILKKTDTFDDILARLQDTIKKNKTALLSRTLAKRLSAQTEIDSRWLEDIAPIQLHSELVPIPNSFQGLVFIASKDEYRVIFNSAYCSDEEKVFILNQVARHLAHLANQFEKAKTQQLQETNLLTELEIENLLSFNRHACYKNHPNLIVELLTQNAQKHPHHIAVKDGNRSITYGELNDLTNNIAFYLQQIFPKNLPIVVSIDRSLEFIIAVIGVFKSGAVYVPMTPDTPIERQQLILQEANAVALITRENSAKPSSNFKILTIESLLAHRHEKNLPTIRHTLDDNAYIIFTSGSTGKPKGVPIKRKGLLNCILWYQETFKLSEKSTFGMTASTGFDASVAEIWWNLCAGTTLHIVHETTLLDPSQFITWMNQEKISHCFLTTALMNLLLKLEKLHFDHPVVIFTAGDKLAKIPRPIENLTLYNLYGPAENTIITTYHRVNYEEAVRRPPPIGKPTYRSEVYIGNNQLKPAGVKGELLIGGENLFSGYINNQEENEKVFIAFRISGKNKTLYRSGDMVRRLPSGEIEYIERKNRQIKIRGYRVEIDEIEHEIASFPGIKEVVVSAKETEENDYLLSAHIVQQKNHSVNTAALKTYLRKKMPPYMIPSIFYFLDKIPLSINKKIDRIQLKTIRKIEKQNHADKNAELLSYLKSLLSNDAIDFNTNLFEAGITSITAIYLAWKIEEIFNIKISSTEIFEHLTLKKLLKNKKQIEKAALTVEKNKKISRAPISLEQLPLYQYAELYPEAVNYNITTYWKLPVNTESQILENILNEIIQVQIALRIIFEGHQLIEKNNTLKVMHLKNKKDTENAASLISSEFPLKSHDIKKTIDPAGNPHEAGEKAETWQLKKGLQSALIDSTKIVFDIEKGPLMRACLYTIDDETYFILTMHHLIFDGWSLNILCELINKRLKGEKIYPPAINYLQYAENQKTLQDKSKNEKIKFWKSLNTPSEIHFHYKKNKQLTPPSPSIKKIVEKKYQRMIKEMTAKQNISLFTLLISSYAFLLNRYTQESQVLIAGTHFNRDNKALKDTIGYFVNIIPIVFTINENSLLNEFLLNAQKNIYEHFDHALPLHTLKEEVLPELNIEALFTLQLDGDTHLHFNENSSSHANVFYLGHKYPLSMSARLVDDALHLTLEFDPDLVSLSQAKRLLDNYHYLLSEISTAPSNTKLQDIAFITPDEIQQIEKFEHGEKRPLSQQNLFELIKKSADTRLNKIAVITENNQKTYQELLLEANQLANALWEYKPLASDRVGVMLEKSTALIASLLGILQVGAIFVIIDPSYPDARIADMLQDADIQIIVTQKKYHTACLQDKNVIYTDEPTEDMRKKIENYKIIHPENPAYTIYTSGTTGKPKGITIKHQAVINTLLEKIKLLPTTTDSRILSLSPVGFDAMIWEACSSLIAGSTLFFAEKSTILSQEKFSSFLLEHHITEMTITPSLLSALDPNKTPKIHTIVCASERLSGRLIQRWKNHCERFFNAYGSTETAICATLSNLHESNKNTIGRPLANTRLMILNHEKKRVPLNAKGEIHIASPALSDGYLNQPRLTAEKFIYVPALTTEKLYCSGDVGLFDEDGQIIYIERTDNQIKYHGFRIEPNEINAALEELDEVQASFTCLQHIQNAESLLSYIIADKPINEKAIKLALFKKLPAHLIPAHIIQVPVFPRNQNDKINPKAFPVPAQFENKKPILSAKNDSESKLLHIWRAIFQKEAISTDDDFFEIGGTSILAIKLIDQINEVFEKKISYATLISAPTIALLAMTLEEEAPRTQALVCLSQQATGVPVIFIHPMGGTIFWYLNYAKRIENRPVYAIEDPAIYDQPTSFHSLKDTAIDYIARLQAQIPHGPYILSGASSGANIAVEMTRLLKEKNETVQAIISLDGWSRYPHVMHETDFMKKVLQTQLETMRQQFDYHKIKQSDSWLTRQLERTKLMLNYQPDLIEAPFFLMKASTLTPEFKTIDSPYNYWDQYCKRPITVYKVPGNHETMHFPPNAEKLATAINQALAEIDKKQNKV